MLVRIQRWGNSQGLRLSKQVLNAAGIVPGDAIELVPTDGQIVLKRVARPPFNLADLVAKMPADYQTVEEDLGKPEGREEW